TVKALTLLRVRSVMQKSSAGRWTMKKLAALVVVALLSGTYAASAQSTLKAVKDRGNLNCGANGTLAGFGLPDAQGNWTGLDVDFCRAIAAAVLNDASKVKF